MNDKKKAERSLIIVSNRLPIVLRKKADDSWTIAPGSGGLVTALAPVLKNRGGVWIGWPGNVMDEEFDLEKLLREQGKTLGYQLKSVSLTRKEKENYYQGFANEVLWPLFHDFMAHCNFKPDYWEVYQQVNNKFAQVTHRNLSKDSFVWVHDYHLIGLASSLRGMGVQNKLAFFLHIPFPPPDIFIRLPWRFEILNALLDYDLVGLQTIRDRRNFLQCVRRFVQDVNINGSGQVMRILRNGREIRVGVFPISIDFKEFDHLARTPEVDRKVAEIRKNYSDRKIIFGIDRMDYSKGIPERLRAFRYALRHYPELKEKVTFVQIMVPSRREITRYANLKIEIERLVGEINGQFTQPGWVPVHYMFTTLNREQLVAYYRASDIALLTPLKDGMNLIAKEFCAANVEEKGILILSEFAGAAAQFQQHAILVNPHDIVETATAIKNAYDMSLKKIDRPIKKLRQNVKKFDIFWWVDSFLLAAIEKNLDSFPRMDDYIPQAEDESFKGMPDEI
ncbi:MAG: trehalose-6-phosphate synthase [Calditrichaeota bacterium]|nr:trehalose-6-phosphate synthase [Calditrichota bacterium]RQV99061.1 MAG: trehalose-6-phosphate synthase [Calditrichota bacterium]